MLTVEVYSIAMYFNDVLFERRDNVIDLVRPLALSPCIPVPASFSLLQPVLQTAWCGLQFLQPSLDYIIQPSVENSSQPGVDYSLQPGVEYSLNLV